MKKAVAGILAHVDAGKTTLSEALLFETGVIKKAGRVDSGDTHLDTDSVECERGITIYSKNARFSLGDKEMILIDTPGHVDFSTEVERALSVMDAAILLISAPAGIQPHTKTLWSLLKLYHLPVLFFVNKMDMEGADREQVLAQLKKEFSGNVTDFSDVVMNGADTGNPDDSVFYEDVATCDENLMEKLLDGENIGDDEIAKLIAERKIFPVFFGSALKCEGITEFLRGLERFLPTKETTGDGFSARVYKIARDAQGKRLTYLKVLSGSLKVKQLLSEEKVNEIRLYTGDRYENVQEATAGDICCVVGLENTKNGMIYGDALEGKAPVLAPALSYAVHFPMNVDRNKMLRILQELEEEDPSLSVEYREQTREIFVSLMGEVQTEVLKRAISDRYGIAVTFTDGKVCYRETVDGTGIGIGHFEPLRHYAEVQLRLEPGERGSGMEFATEVSEDLLDRNWQRLILTHLGEREHKGVLTGGPITDMKITLVAGRAHVKHTEGGDFRQATYRAIRQGLMELRETGHVRLLEPYYDYTLEIPETYVGRAMTDITNMKGTAVIAENDFENHITVLTGHAPVSTMNGYMREVAAYTKGLGRLFFTVSGYEMCPNEEEVLAATKYNPEADLRNPCDSVFCSHGAGVVVPWYDVPSYKHVDYSAETGMILNTADAEAQENNRMRRDREREAGRAFVSTEEIDALLHNSTHANENKKKAEAKGISRAVDERRREERSREKREREAAAKPVEYRGTKHKDRYLLVDGYNIIHAWDELNALLSTGGDAATGRLNDILCAYAAVSGHHLIVVYDAYRVKGHPVEVSVYNNITVVYTKEAQTADQYIERYAHENVKKYDITVVTSDGLEQVIVAGSGCNIVSSRGFQETVERETSEFNARHGVQ